MITRITIFVILALSLATYASSPAANTSVHANSARHVLRRRSLRPAKIVIPTGSHGRAAALKDR